MLKSISLCSALLAMSINLTSAETISPMGVTVTSSGAQLSLSEASTLVVNLTVERESIAVGKYARYAQKYLGVRASLVARESATLVSGDVALAPKDFYVADSQMLTADAVSETTPSLVESLPIDMQSSTLLSVEEAAEEAAEAIFRIRKLRNDIISGELGEGFFGGGLAAALERLDLEENAYTELFLGHTTRSRERVVKYVTLNGDTPRYIVCRFSATDGVVEASNVSDEPIILQLTAVDTQKLSPPVIAEKASTVSFRIPSMVSCELLHNTSKLTSKSIPLNEFGYDYVYPVSSK